ncbi:MAG TPA: hypothetical protein VLF87_01485 [Patescibacteria group bacterium]|nr:hypothetical protein [Patescibacteria group bacterium]
MKFKAIIVAVAIVAPLLITEPVAAKSTSYQLAPGGSCNKYHGFTGPVQGEVSLKTDGKAGSKTKYQIKADAQGLAPDKTLEVWFGDLYLKNGQVKGCSAFKVKTVKVDKKGRLHADGSVTENTNSLPKQVFIVTSFSAPGLVTNPINF